MVMNLVAFLKFSSTIICKIIHEHMLKMFTYSMLHTRAICVELKTGKGETSNDPQEKYRIDEVS